MLAGRRHPHTIDRWDDATGENLVKQIAAVGAPRPASPAGGALGVTPRVICAYKEQ